MERKEVYLLFVGDRWLMHNSLQLLAVCSSKDMAAELAKLDAQNNCDELTEEDFRELTQDQQTQCRDNNYLITSVYMDEL